MALNVHAHELHRVFSNSATPFRNPRPKDLTAKSGTIFSAKAFANGSWYLFDALVLFRMGTIYLHRFEDFEHCVHEPGSIENDREITLWRDEQQKEWDRLSITMALLGTMNAGIIKLAPTNTADGSFSQGTAPSLWLGAAGLSLCGVFLVQYYSHNYIVPRTAVAMSISGPPLMALWSSALFVAGIVVFVAQTDFRTRFKVFALAPLTAGVVAVLISLLFGEIMGIMMYKEKKEDRASGTPRLGTRWCKHPLHPSSMTAAHPPPAPNLTAEQSGSTVAGTAGAREPPSGNGIELQEPTPRRHVDVSRSTAATDAVTS